MSIYMVYNNHIYLRIYSNSKYQILTMPKQQLLHQPKYFPDEENCGSVCLSRASQVAQWMKNLPAMREMPEIWVRSLDGEDPWRRKWQPAPLFLPEESHGQRYLEGYSS